MLFVILIIVNRGVFAGQHIVRLIRRVASEVTRIQGFLINSLFTSVHIDDIRLGHGNLVDRAVVPKAIPFHCCIVNCILEFVICQISSRIQLTPRLGMVDHRQDGGRSVGISIIGITVLVQKDSMPVALFCAKVIIRCKLLLCLERPKIPHGRGRSHRVCDRSVESCRSNRPYYLGRHRRTAADRAGSSITDRIKRNQRERNVFNGFV